jgi:ADP-heptose:LPS heptosyltransferase
MTSPAQYAQRIREWLELQDQAALPRIMEELHPEHDLLRSLDAIADAADSHDQDLAREGVAALFGGLVEQWNDRLSSTLRAVYSRLFGHVIWHCAQRDALMHAALGEHGIRCEEELVSRHRRLRSAQGRAPAMVQRLLVLSRVTIGADILLTSVLLQHLRQAWPSAEILLVGDPKIEGLLGGLSGMRLVPLRYARRGRLTNRLRAWLAVRELVAIEDPDLVINPDPRLDQLGLLPLIDEEKTYLWENTFPASGPDSLARLMSHWCSQRLPNACNIAVRPQLFLPDSTRVEQQRLRRAFGNAPMVAVKLDHGGNPAKALPRAAEMRILKHLRLRGWRILIDRGFGDEEYANSDALLAETGLQPLDLSDSDARMGLSIDSLEEGRLAAEPVIRFHGSIAGWAACLGCCRLAVSYDSVGQHLAAAAGIPVVVPFAGYEHPQFPVAWQPIGHAPVHVHRFDSPAAKSDPARLEALLADIPPAMG